MVLCCLISYAVDPDLSSDQLTFCMHGRSMRIDRILHSGPCIQLHACAIPSSSSILSCDAASFSPSPQALMLRSRKRELGRQAI